MAGKSEALAGAGERRLGAGFWIFGLLPLVLLAGLLAFFGIVGPAGVFEAAFPPVEELTIERIYFDEDGIGVEVVNGGPETVTIAQVTVDEALWQFEAEPDAELGRLDRATLRIPYPWSEGEPHSVVLISSGGVAFEKTAEVATAAPAVDGRYLGTFTLLGLYVGVIPVLIGLLWFPFLRRLSERWLSFFLSFTIGLLLFLGIDTVDEALELASNVAAAFQGVALAAGGAVVAFLVVAAVDRAMTRRAGGAAGSTLVLVPWGSACTTWARAWRSARPTPAARSRWGRCWWWGSRRTIRPKGWRSRRRWRGCRAGSRGWFRTWWRPG